MKYDRYPKSKPINIDVTVVPIFAPKMTPIACSRLITPALTKLMAITVVADEDWIKPVMTIPTKTPIIGLEVYFSTYPLNLGPAKFVRASPIRDIPNRNMARPPAMRFHCRELNDCSCIIPPKICIMYLIYHIGGNFSTKFSYNLINIDKSGFSTIILMLQTTSQSSVYLKE